MAHGLSLTLREITVPEPVEAPLMQRNPHRQGDRPTWRHAPSEKHRAHRSHADRVTFPRAARRGGLQIPVSPDPENPDVKLPPMTIRLLGNRLGRIKASTPEALQRQARDARKAAEAARKASEREQAEQGDDDPSVGPSVLDR